MDFFNILRSVYEVKLYNQNRRASEFVHFVLEAIDSTFFTSPHFSLVKHGAKYYLPLFKRVFNSIALFVRTHDLSMYSTLSYEIPTKLLVTST